MSWLRDTSDPESPACRASTPCRRRSGCSEGKASAAVAQHCSTQRLAPPTPPEDAAALRACLRDFSKLRPKWGWRRAAKAARRDAWRVNDKRIQRLWRDRAQRLPPEGDPWTARVRPQSGAPPCPRDRSGCPRFPRASPDRNRIIAILTDLVVAVECHCPGGSFPTVETAARCWAVPESAVPVDRWEARRHTARTGCGSTGACRSATSATS